MVKIAHGSKWRGNQVLGISKQRNNGNSKVKSNPIKNLVTVFCDIIPELYQPHQVLLHSCLTNMY